MRLVTLALAVVISIFPLWPIYQSPTFILTVVGAAVLAGLLSWLSLRNQWSLLRTTLTAVVIFLLAGVPLAVPSQALWGFLPTPAGFITLLSGTVLSWKQLVTVAAPVGSYEALLVPPYALVFFGIIAAALVSRAKKTAPWAPAVPMATLALSIWLGPSRSSNVGVITVAVFACLALWFATARGTFGKASVRALGIIVMGSLVAGAMALVMPVTDRTVWRTQIEQPFVLQDDTSPLSEYRNYVAGDFEDLNLVSVEGIETGGRVSLATLDAYNGVIFSVGGSSSDFTRVPGAISTANLSGDAVSATVTIEDLSGPWIPLPAVLGDIDFVGQGSQFLTDSFYYSRQADTGAVVSALTPGDTYRVRGVSSPQASLSDLTNFVPGTAIVPAPKVVPDGLDAFIALNSSATDTPAEKLSKVLSALVDEGYVSHGQSDEVPSASGHGANRLSSLFATEPMVGDAEQYASAAALIATQIGFPARVVLGFIADDDEDSAPKVTFTGADMTAWIEISTANGWVAVDPNPVVRPIPEEQPDDPTEVAFPQSAVEPPPTDQTTLTDSTVPEAAEEEEPEATDPALQAILGVVSVSAWILLILGILASPLIVIALLKSRKRRRRQGAPDPRARVIGAWDQLRDVLQDNGFALDASMTRHEIAQHSGMRNVGLIAHLGDAAQYSSDSVPPADSDQAWREVDAVAVELGAAQTRWQRMKTTFAVGSLGMSWSWLTSRFPWRR